MKEHDDDLEVGVSSPRVAQADTEIAAAISVGLERIATVLERGLHDLASAIAAAHQGEDRTIRHR